MDPCDRGPKRIVQQLDGARIEIRPFGSQFDICKVWPVPDSWDHVKRITVTKALLADLVDQANELLED